MIGIGQKPNTVRLHPAQLAMAENAAITVLGVTELCRFEVDPNDHEKILDTLRHLPPRTLAGIPIREDPTCPADVIEFEDARGEVIAKIRGLAMPAGWI